MGTYKSCHAELNNLSVILVTCKDYALVCLPPIESSFKQHFLRACIEVKVRMTSHEEKPHIGYPYDFFGKMTTTVRCQFYLLVWCHPTFMQR